MRLLVCGGRSYKNREFVYAKLDELHAARPITCVIQGGATGVDTFAFDWAKTRGIYCEPYPINEQDRKSYAGLTGRAGNHRNARMLREGKPKVIVAFAGGSGTHNMITQAKLAGVEVIQFKLGGDRL